MRSSTLIDYDFAHTNFGNAKEYIAFVREYIENQAELPPDIRPYLLDD